MPEEKYEDRTSIFHYNDKTGMYKVLAINPTDKKDGVFVSIRTGIKGGNKDQLSLMANKQEIAYLIMDLTEIYHELE